MNLFETLRGIFNPKIKKEFNSLIAERKRLYKFGIINMQR